MEAFRYAPHYTVEDYLQWEGDWELWRGIAVAMSPSPGLPHAKVAGNLFFSLRSQLNDAGDHCRCEVLAEIDWHVADDEVLRPDLLVVCDPTRDFWIKKLPELVIEVISPGSLRRDTIHKRGLYREAGVRFFVLADPDTRKLRCLHLDEDGEYVPGPPDFELHEGCRISLNASEAWEGLPPATG